MRAERPTGRRASGLLLASAAAALLLGTAGPVRAQQSASDSVRVYSREVFDYPSRGRRNPFAPLNEGERTGPRFEDLQLAGVLYNAAVGSVATLTDQKTHKRYRVREGDDLGEVRVVAIRPDEVDFVITSFGISRRETLKVKKDKEQQG